PTLWGECVARWRDMQRPLLRAAGPGEAPDPETEWLIYQALAGVWPLHFDANDNGRLAELRQRFATYLEKAMREAKLGSSWTDVNADFERAVQDYAANLLRPANRSFREDFDRTMQAFMRAGAINGLSQVVL